MSYIALKYVHMSLAIVSISGFTLRWFWMQSGSKLFQYKLTRVLPHIVDTLFLGSGIWLTFTIGQYPLSHGWLSTKLLGLVAYIVLGSLALKRAPTNKGKTLAFIAALLCFAWIVSVALSKQAWGVVSLLFQ